MAKGKVTKKKAAPKAEPNAEIALAKAVVAVNANDLATLKGMIEEARDYAIGINSLRGQRAKNLLRQLLATTLKGA